MMESLPTDPMQWVMAFEAMSGLSKAAFWVFTVAVAARIGGESIAKILTSIGDLFRRKS